MLKIFVVALLNQEGEVMYEKSCSTTSPETSWHHIMVKSCCSTSEQGKTNHV